MDPLPQFDQLPNKDAGHDTPLWPWEAEPQAAAKKLDKEEPKPNKKTQKPEKEELSAKEAPKNSADQEKPDDHTSLIEQAMALITQHEEEPTPHDPSSVARIMLAYHTLHLYEQLQHPEQLPDDISVETIKATLDHITQLDAKLQDPALEVPPEIDASYHELLHLAETALQDEPNPDTIIAELSTIDNVTSATTGDTFSPLQKPAAVQSKHVPKDISSFPHADLMADEFERRKQAAAATLPATAGAALIYHITHLRRRKKQQPPEAETSLSLRGNPTHPSPSGATSQTTAPISEHSVHAATRPRVNSPQAERTARPASRREFVPIARPASRLATAAVATTLIGNNIRQNNEHSHALDPTPSPRPLYEAASATRHSTETHADIPAESSRKIEHMPLVQLLAMAEAVPLGHGRYLRREFESGTIDREGLIKILKAQSKGQDFHEEFRQQATRFATLKATSPEFLHGTSPKQPHQDTTAPEKIDVAARAHTENPVSKKPVISQPVSLAPPRGNQLLLPKFARSSLQSKPQTVRQLLITTGVLVGGLVIVGLLAGAVLMLLG